MIQQARYTIAFADLTAADAGRVGGKNAALGELIRSLGGDGVRVPPGFAIDVSAYWNYLRDTGIESVIGATLRRLSSSEIAAREAAEKIRSAILAVDVPPALRAEVVSAYAALGGADVAVRSSAPDEDSTAASFAGQHETYLNVRGESGIIDAYKMCLASLFSERAIAYREEQGLDHAAAALSVGVQKMVRSDLGASGVAFTIDPETGFPDVVLIDGAWGLGEGIVRGRIDPDEFMAFKSLLDDGTRRPIVEKSRGAKREKFVYGTSGESVQAVRTSAEERDAFVLSDAEVLQLARWAVAVEKHFRRPMNIEWAKDGRTGELFIVQTRPETVEAKSDPSIIRSYRLTEKGRPLATGHAVGDAIATGKACLLNSPADLDKFKDGSILVVRTTDPDWVPLMRRASAIVADHGGRTSHAAIVSRKLGLPAITGTGNATHVLGHGQTITVSCAEGHVGRVYEGQGRFTIDTTEVGNLPRTKTKIMLNVGDPGQAMRWWRLPADGIGLARTESIISNAIRCHPMAFARFDSIQDPGIRRQVLNVAAGFPDPRRFFVETLGRGIARIAATFHRKPVIVRTSDFKTNEYANLIGGALFEPIEENPMLGWRGASRYCHGGYRDAFALECQAIRYAREEIGLANIVVVIPFCRTPDEAAAVTAAMAENGLISGKNGLEIHVMCELPANVILIEEFAKHFDGFSIGSNDLTQLVLGADRDSDRLAAVFDESNPAVVAMITAAVLRAHGVGRKIGLCGQGPSDSLEFAKNMTEAGVDSMSVAPDSFVKVRREVAAVEIGMSRSGRPRGNRARTAHPRPIQQYKRIAALGSRQTRPKALSTRTD